jgi:hypothetical protein
MRRIFPSVFGFYVSLLIVSPLLAHHAVSAEFDTTKPIQFSGAVVSVDWMNPHIYVNIEAKNEAGKTITYSVEGGAPNALFRQGWRKDTLKPGDFVKVDGIRAKRPESNRIGSATITMSDGRVFARGNAQ